MQEEKTSSFVKKFGLFYSKIINTCRQIDTPEDRHIYLKTIINDCDKICETAELLEEYDINPDFLRKTNLDVDNNFYWLVDDNSNGPGNDTINMVKEDSQSFMSFELSKLIESTANLKIDGIKKIQMHLEFDSEKVCEKNEDNTFTGHVNNMDRNEKIKITSSFTDVVRILEAMKKSGIISTKTPVQLLAELFFTEIADKNIFEKKYNATKNRLEKEKSSTRSQELLNFMRNMSNDCFANNNLQLDEFIIFLEKLQNTNII